MDLVMGISKQISVRFSDEQVIRLEGFCKTFKTDMAGTIRLIFDEWAGRKEHSEACLLGVMSDQKSERQALNSQNKLIISALKLVFSAQIASKEFDYWSQESVILSRKRAQEMFNKTLNEMERISSDV